METNTEAYLRYDPTKETAWIKAIFDALGEKADHYYKLASQQLVTMLLIVIAKKDHVRYLSQVETNYAGVGLMNLMGNKGGVAVRFRFHDSYYCFVTSHLAAFVDKVEKRNQDFTEIAKRLVFHSPVDSTLAYLNFAWNNGGDEGVSFLESHNVIHQQSNSASIFHADHLIWLGDLNYRVNLTEAEIKMRLQQGEIDYLLQYDQLLIERQAGRTFSMFEEGTIAFSPTYKYDAGTNQYDTSEKRRAPSWTDRILWKTTREPKGQQRQKLVSYSSCMEMMTSDHKPVRALMETQVRRMDSQKLALTRNTLSQQLAGASDELTKAKISTSFVEFGSVQFMEYKERSVVLENTGLMLAPFRFIRKIPGHPAIPSWLHVKPTSGVLGPGEKILIQFELTIDPTLSASFNRGESKINDILVIHMENGSDFFVEVTGDYQPTCFGVPLEELASMLVPVNQVSRSPSLSRANPTAPPQPQPQPQLQPQQVIPYHRQAQQAKLPKELWKILNFLWNKNMLSIESLFLEHGDRIISHYIRHCMDTGEPFDTAVLLGEDVETQTVAIESLSLAEKSLHAKEVLGANSMIDVLVAFLDCLPESVIPTHLYTLALEAADASEAMSTLMTSLPHTHLNVLHYITDFLHDAMDYAPDAFKEQRRLRIMELFSVLIRPPVDYKERNPAWARQKQEKCIGKLLRT
ncbi:Endonuclease/exonuclease/phosphatase [Spinellus fusiger]|nr:Endonuclease/exonuclease/phosphatase [Spinellus fusiger]